MKGHKITSFVLGFLISCSIGQASEEPQDTTKIYRLQEVVITATRSTKHLFDVGRNISVITRDHIQNSMYNSVAEVLSEQGGMYIVGTGQNPGMIQSIFTRGANSNHTAIMIDDIRITDPSGVNNAPDLMELSLVNVDQIEIIRGSHSTPYGSSPIGGIINFITTKDRPAGFHADIEIKSGTFGKNTSTFSQNLFLNYTLPVGLYFTAAVNNSNTKGLDATVDTVSDPNAYKNRDKDGFDKIVALAKIGFKNDTWDVYTSYTHTKENIDFDKGAYRDDDNSTIDFKRNLLTYGASYKVTDELNIKYVGGFSNMKRFVVDDSSVVDNMGNTDHTYSDGTYRGSIFNNELLGNLRLADVDVVLGVGIYREAMGSKTYFFTSQFGGFETRTDLDTLNLETTTKNIFAHADVHGRIISESLQRFSLGLGTRLNRHSIFGTHFTYEVNPSLKLNNDALVYFSYSTGFNAPSLYQLFSPDKNYISGITRGNKNLKPETSHSYEVGLKQRFTNNISFAVSYFHTVVANAIEYVYLWDRNIGIDTLGFSHYRGDTYLNLGNLTSRGVEFNLNAQLNKDLYFTGNVSVVSGRLHYNPSDIDISQTGGNHVQVFSNGAFINKTVETLGLVRRPNTVNLSLTYKPIEKLALRVDVRHVGARSDIFYSSTLGPFGALGTVPVADYTLVDFSQKFTLNEHISLSARVENMFDTKYVEINGFTTRGRGLYVSVRYSL